MFVCCGGNKANGMNDPVGDFTILDEVGEVGHEVRDQVAREFSF